MDKNNLYEIIIGEDLIINTYLDNYSVNIIERYATNTNFTSISGKSMNKYLGDRRELSVNFEPMETYQINELFKGIKKYRNNIPITYIDPQLNKITKHFSCNTLPAATYFVSDDGRKFWTIPTVTFSETDESASEDDDDPEWNYIIQINDDVYSDDEISNNISISVSAGSSGWSVGQCSTSTISGSLLYKGDESIVNKNTILFLFCEHTDKTTGKKETQEYRFFIKSYTIENKAVIHFSASDIMAFTDNSYPMQGTVAKHIQAATQVIAQLVETGVRIIEPAFSQIEIVNQSGWSIRTLLEYACVYGAVNYSALKDVRKTDGVIEIFTVDSTTEISFSQDDYSALSVGIMGATIEQIRVCQSQMDDPYLEEGMTYEDFGIYYLRDFSHNKANVLNLVCPWVEDDIKYVGQLSEKIGTSYGTEFSCENVKVNDFYPPYIKVNFEGYESEGYTFFVSNANYKLTSIGIFASISGDTKSLSDFEYIGKTETEMKTKVALQMGYQHGYITVEDGIFWDDSAIPAEGVVDSG